MRRCALALLWLGSLLFGGVPAHAATVTDRPLLFGFDGSDTTAGRFTTVASLEIDQSSGAVYVLSGPDLDKFNVAGEAREFSATGSSSLDPGYNARDLAVDNYGPNQGRVHLIGEGGPLTALNPAGSLEWELAQLGPNIACGIAIDTAGHPWIADVLAGDRKIREYAATGSPPVEIGSIGTEPKRVCPVDIDAAGNLYVIHRFGIVDNPFGSVHKYEGGKIVTVDGFESRAVSVDQSAPSGHVFTLHPEGFNEYDASGALQGTFAINDFRDGRGIAYDKALDRIYVADGETNTVKVFGPPLAGTVADVTTEAGSEVGVSRVRLNGKIDPQGTPNSYFFEWKEGTGPSWAAAKSTAPQSIEPTDSVEHAVSATLTGLPGNTTYEVRLVATNTESDLSNRSSSATVTTAKAAAAPGLTIAALAPASATSAEVSGTVDPREDFSTTWRLELSTDPACASGFLAQPSHDLESEANGPLSVSEELTGLVAGQRYCVRIVAKNSFGTTTSEAREFETDAIPPSQAFTAFASPRLDTSARLNGTVNPEGADSVHPLTYRFEYSKDGGKTWIALPDRQYSGGAREQIVLGEELGGLGPNTTYSFRFSAENESGAASPQGEARTFTTRSAAEVAPTDRGIELVNNPDKGNQNVFSPALVDFSLSGKGEAALWSVQGGAPGGSAATGNVFLARRTATGWHSQNLIPPAAEQLGEASQTYGVERATPDFRHFLFSVGTVFFGSFPKALVRLDSEGHQDVLGSYQHPVYGSFGEITDDGAHVLIVNPDNDQLEDLGPKSPEPISVMPGGTASQCGLASVNGEIGESFAGASGSQQAAGVSWNPGYRMMDAEDAARVYFEVRPDGDCAGLYGLYERDREGEATTLIDPGALGHHVEFIRSAPDGRRAYFATHSQLDPADRDSTADVYRWDEAAGRSSCLTCAVGGTAPAAVRGPVMVSDDFSHVYFQSEEQLVPGYGSSGQLNTYALSGDTLHFVGGIGIGALDNEGALLSADGEALVFRSANGIDARGLSADRLAPQCTSPPSHPEAPKPCQEIYRYDDRDGAVECLSCRHDGVTTYNAGAAYINRDVDFKMSRDGDTVAFATIQALLPADVNQAVDVYEWREGAVHLVTDGVRAFPEGTAATQVQAVSDDGKTVLFAAAALGLSGFELDGLTNLYAARIGGGFDSPGSPASCFEDSCQGELRPPPSLRQPASASFEGRGNARARHRCAGKRTHRHRRCRARHPNKGSGRQARHGGDR